MANPTVQVYAFSYELLDNKGVNWSDPSRAIGQNDTEEGYASSVCEGEVDTFIYRTSFDREVLLRDIPDGSVVSKITFRVKYKGDTGGIYSTVSVEGPDMTSGSKHTSLGFVPTTIENDEYNTETNDNTFEYLATYSEANFPDLSNIISQYFAFEFYFHVKNSTTSCNVKLFEIRMEVEYAEGRFPSYTLTEPSFSPNALQYGDSINLGTVLVSTVNRLTFHVMNSDVKLTYPAGGIYTDTGTMKIANCPVTVSGVYSQNAGEEITFNVDCSAGSVGSYSGNLYLSTDDPTYPLFYITISFIAIAAPPQGHPVIALKYNNVVVAKNGILSIPSAPEDISTTATVVVNNSGTDALSISVISVTGDGTVASGSVGTGSTIVQNSSGNINLNLQTSDLGNKSVRISVVSNDPTNNVYSITLNYAILPQAKLDFVLSGTAVVDGDEFSLGTLDRGKSFTKSYSLKNSGIYKSIVINSVSVSGDVQIQGTPAFPLTLTPNNANAGAFTLVFPTDVVGLKTGTLTIDWNEAT